MNPLYIDTRSLLTLLNEHIAVAGEQPYRVYLVLHNQAIDEYHVGIDLAPFDIGDSGLVGRQSV